MLNPKQSDYAGRYRLAALAATAGAASVSLGAYSSSETLTTVLVSGGIGLVIAGVLTAWSARKSQERARQARES